METYINGDDRERGELEAWINCCLLSRTRARWFHSVHALIFDMVRLVIINLYHWDNFFNTKKTKSFELFSIYFYIFLYELTSIVKILHASPGIRDLVFKGCFRNDTSLEAARADAARFGDLGDRIESTHFCSGDLCNVATRCDMLPTWIFLLLTRLISF